MSPRRSRLTLSIALTGALVIGAGADALTDPGFATAPKGRFMIGDRHPDAEPEERWRPVAVGLPFTVAKTEVTQEQWASVMGSNPNATAQGRSATNPFFPGPPCADFGVGDALPVSCVTFEEALLYCNALSSQRNLTPPYSRDEEGVWQWDRQADGYRLLTHLEWEVVARAGTEQAWDGADRPQAACARANVLDATAPSRAAAHFPCEDGHAALAPVASHTPNAWGLYDVTGNVAEWVWWDREPDAPRTLRVKQRITWPVMRRGGSYAHGPREARLGHHQPTGVAYRWPDTGLRLARGP